MEFRFVAPVFEDRCQEGFDAENITPTDALNVGWATRATEEKILRILFGIVSGIVADGEVNADEFEFLSAWRREHSNESLAPGLRPVFQKLDDVLSDGVLTLAEALELLDAIGERLGSWTRYRPETTAVQMLLGLTQGALADRSITRGELQTLCDWLDALGEYRCDSTFAGVESAVRRAAADFTPEAESELIRELENYVDPCRNLSTDVDVEFEAKRFVLSGRFAFGKKRDVAGEIAKRGGEVATSVSPKIDYLIVGGEKSVLWKYDNYGCKVDAARRLKKEGRPIEILGEGELLTAFERDETKEDDAIVKIDRPEPKSGFFGGVSAFARSVGGSMKSAANAVGSATSSAANAVGSATSSAASAVVEGAKSLVPEKKPETALVFYRGDFLVFEDRIEKHGRKYYFNALKNLTIEKRVRETSSVEVGSLLGRAAMGALNGAANGGLIGAVAGGVSGAIDGGDAKESKPKETRTEYLIGAPERPDRDEIIYSTDEADDANETLREILAALSAADATPALWKNGRKTDAENFRFD